MTQEVHAFDLRVGYEPIDPNAFPHNDHATQGEDKPAFMYGERIQIAPYDGFNFMPTPQGHASYFGINSKLNITALAGNVDEQFMIQDASLNNKLVALTETGIWTKDASTSGAWTQEIVLAAPTAGTHKNWSKCVINNEIFVYRQTEASVWRANLANSFVFTAFVPTFLNMAGQLGIFKAGGRLGFWDSLNSIAWSALDDPTNVTPSLETLSGNTIFQDIVGKITNILPHGDGFVIYCTRSIVLVIRQPDSPMLWSGHPLLGGAGVAYREEVTAGQPDTQHFAFTTEGFIEVVNGVPKVLIPEIATYLKEKRTPIYLKLINGRYLFFPILDASYLAGRANFFSETVAGSVFSFAAATKAISDFNAGKAAACRALLAAEKAYESYYLNINYGYTSSIQASAIGKVPIWEDRIQTYITLATLEAYKATNPGFFGDYTYFNGLFATGNVASIAGGNISTLPTGLPLVSALAIQTDVRSNAQSFFMRQEYAWWAEDRFFKDWKEAAIRKQIAPVTVSGQYYAAVTSPPGSGLVTTTSSFGPFIDLSIANSEADKYYGIANKSAWLQRSLTRGVNYKVDSDVRTSYAGVSEMGWRPSPAGTFNLAYATYAALIANVGTDILNTYNTNFPANAPWFLNSITETAGVSGDIINDRQVDVSIHNTPSPGSPVIVTYVPYIAGSSLAANNGIFTHAITNPLTGTKNYNLATGQPVYGSTATKTQNINAKRFDPVGYDTCIYKELGHTKIKGHGHYTALGAFVVDDATAEAADYTDYCTTTPKKLTRPFFNSLPIGNPWNNGALCGQVYTPTLAAVAWSYPPINVIFPSGTILLQRGSIEPIYPTFVGAFVYDIQYKKWGKMKQDFKALLDYYPLNSNAGDAPIPYDTFLPKAALFDANGDIKLFDNYPADSQIVYGRYGTSRKGYTDLHEVHIAHRAPYSGRVVVESSIDGTNIEPSLTRIQSYTNVKLLDAPFNLSARWYNLIIEGNYDLIHLEARSRKSGKR